ncbi:MAG: nickel pincer cofactor biosynthesis protein LarC [Lachnospiraceae bacterium]|nr:nickel pincer cofactor biosynthesis protein LarC [Lachnospiraceae bacterium]
MKTLYFDLGMGAAGDMLTAALLEIHPEPEAFLNKLNVLNIPGVSFECEKSVKCGITGTHMSVKINGEEEMVEDYHAHQHEHSHGHDHNHEHSHEYDHEHNHDHEHGRDHEHNHDHDHSHDHEHGHDQEHNHEHDYGHDHDHEHNHDHDHSHDHQHGHHHHTGLHEIEHIVRDHLNVSEGVKNDIMTIYGLIAEAESHAHGVSVEQIHFHEVGSMDAVADIAAVCMLMEDINPDMVVASPVHVGSGHVHCAHGILPVPAPATAYVLKDVPIYGGRVQGELCTPTGAAILKHFVDKFGDMPIMKTTKIGYGMGKKDFELANCVRVMLGESEDAKDTIYELSCNVDDMTGEKLGYALERFFEAGATEAYTIPINMKKSRPGVLIRVMCRPEDREKIVEAIFKHTTTIGIREQEMNRYVLKRNIEEVETPYGIIRRKNVSGYGVKRSKYEYDDLAKIAAQTGKSIAEIEQEL